MNLGLILLSKISLQLLTSLLCFLPAIAFGSTLRFGPIDQTQAGNTQAQTIDTTVLKLDTDYWRFCTYRAGEWDEGGNHHLSYSY